MIPVSSTQKPRVAALIVAAGRGLRAARSSADGPKQYRALGGRPVLARTLAPFMAHPDVDSVTAVIHPDDRERYEHATADLGGLSEPVEGGAARQASVRNGLEALAAQVPPPDIVLVHDAARPFIGAALISRAIDAARAHRATVPGLSTSDTVVTVDGSDVRTGTLDRGRLRSVQTPQAFAFDLILAAHRAAAGRDDFTDDGAVAEHAGHPVVVFPGEPANVKLTTAADFHAAEQRLAAGLSDVRTGNGFDVHAFGPGDHLMLGGVRVAHGQGLLGHSDADVGLHALTDAILGALADGDIGQHFPPSDPKWRGADSSVFLADACRRVRDRGGVIAHLDLTIIGESPKVGPHRGAIRTRIAEIVGIAAGRIGVKATTTERLGFTGRQEGLAALASATIRLPDASEPF